MAELISFASRRTTPRTFSMRFPDMPNVKANVNPDKANNAESSELTPPFNSCASPRHLLLHHLPRVAIRRMPQKSTRHKTRASVLLIKEYITNYIISLSIIFNTSRSGCWVTLKLRCVRLEFKSAISTMISPKATGSHGNCKSLRIPLTPAW
jgi:hypothetical protein